jgi:hypothetical protein
MSTRALAHGKAAREVLAWLHGRKVRAISMRAEGAGAEPEPRTDEEIREHIRCHLAAPAARMIHEGGTPETHVDLADPDVERAALLACRLPGAGDPVGHMERELDDVLATLKSPRVWHAVRQLAAALSERSSLDGATAAGVIKSALLNGAGAEIEPHPRAIHIVPGAPPKRGIAKPAAVKLKQRKTPRILRRARPAKARRT